MVRALVSKLGMAAVLVLSTSVQAQTPYPPPQPYPQQQPYPPQQPSPQPQPYPQQQPYPPQPGPAAGQPNFQAVAQIEAQDFGVPQQTELHQGAPHGPTPTLIPGGLVITTEGLYMLLQQARGQVLVFDALGGPETLPGALNAVGATGGGTYQDQTQQQFGQYLQQATGGNKNYPMVFYCLSVQCWMSYNAALRAINLGYTQVLWYRGGIEAWKQAGLPTQPAPQQMPQQVPGQMPQPAPGQMPQQMPQAPGQYPGQ